MRRLEIDWLQTLILVATLIVFAAAPLPRASAFALDRQALEQRAAAGDAEALFELADLYERAEQVEQDLALAVQLLQAAAERGHAKAQYRLGLARAAGVGTARDPVQSYVWLTLAAKDAGAAGLLAKSLQEVVKEDLAGEQLAQAEELAAGFEPVTGPFDLPEPAGGKALPVSGSGAPLPDTNCGDLEVTGESDGRVLITGYVALGSPAAAVVEHALVTTFGQPFELQLIEVAPVLCTVLNTFENGPAQIDTSLGLTLRNADGARQNTFQDEEHLVIELAAHDAARHVYLDYFMHEGQVLHLLPGLDYPDNLVPAGGGLLVGDPHEGQPTWQIGPPFGHDLLVALVARRPLYQGRRPEVEGTETYLAFLRERMGSIAAEDAVRVAYRLVETVPR
jgi:Domain of unknown function (DUF4384)/Sel1 repeat